MACFEPYFPLSHTVIAIFGPLEERPLVGMLKAVKQIQIRYLNIFARCSLR
jgi:hypothetical protein